MVTSATLYVLEIRPSKPILHQFIFYLRKKKKWQMKIVINYRGGTYVPTNGVTA